jgi:hypothetical protein
MFFDIKIYIISIPEQQKHSFYSFISVVYYY